MDNLLNPNLWFVYLDWRVTSAAFPVVSRSLLLMDLVVTERVVFWPVTVSAPQSLTNSYLPPLNLA